MNAAGEGVEKFTQRLNSDGSEVDAGPAGGIASLGEGTSVASVTQPPEPSGRQPGDGRHGSTGRQPMRTGN